MTLLSKIENNIKSLSVNDLIRVLSEDKSFTDLIIELNTQKQLFEKGIDSTGTQLSDIGGEYSDLTISIAKENGRPKKGKSHVNLNDQNDFYESWRVYYANGDIMIEADTLKTSWDGTIDLMDRWGANILGLTGESLSLLREKAKEILIPYVRKKILER